MRVRFGAKQFEFPLRMPAKRLLEKLDVLPETVVVVRNEEIITEDEMIEAQDEVELIRVISGGEREV